ncbi:MAG: tRNA 2-thiocytidine(32) synthetase TtcA [Gammaproteobacteria bacterium]|nr:tRNA 2-thiocytidine(32) synthetase TtcA [Gammaproteobacteria bacterium]MYF02957.1 tRNA 2-thiocytidine(32) synthetase TtcA [Gammaproteobacteria bacterium]MYI76706.1 tRNA 2-thiocytidine(32) synthetase TtcA [Gammaproteobacteria bacterium]
MRARYELNKTQKKLRRLVGQAIADYDMIEAGDRVMVCLSGGKDSYTLLETLISLQHNAPVDFSLVAVNVDQMQPNFPVEVIPNYCTARNIEYLVVKEDTYSVVTKVTPEGKVYCPICSRLRRGILYTTARRIKATKIALGHHLDDVVETLFLNLFFGGTMKSMPPYLVSDNGVHHVIRPLYYVREKLIARYSKMLNHPIIPCDLCGSQEQLQRQQIKSLLKEWDQTHPGRVENIARAIRNVKLSHLGDRQLFAFGQDTTNLEGRLLDVAEEVLAQHG